MPFPAGHPHHPSEMLKHSAFCCKLLPVSSTKCSLALLLFSRIILVRTIQQESQKEGCGQESRPSLDIKTLPTRDRALCTHHLPQVHSLGARGTVKSKRQREATAVIKDQEKRSDLHFRQTLASGRYEDLPPPTKTLLSDSNSPHTCLGLPGFSKRNFRMKRVFVLCPGLLLLVVSQFLGGVHSPLKIHSFSVNLYLTSLAWSFLQMSCGPPLATQHKLEWLLCWKV